MVERKDKKEEISEKKEEEENKHKLISEHKLFSDLPSEEFSLKFIIYKDDDEVVKEKVAWVKFGSNGVFIKIGEGDQFWMPYDRVLKVKPYIPKDISKEEKTFLKKEDAGDGNRR
jgi:hypothetical protein